MLSLARPLALVVVLVTAGCSGYAAPTPAPAPKAADPIVVTSTPTPGPANALPPLEVSVSGMPPQILLGTPTTFYASTTTPMGAVSYRWAYSDGGSTPASRASESTHTFGSLGTATITVTATDTRGETSASVTGTVVPIPVTAPTAPAAPPAGPPALVVTLNCTEQPPNVASTCNFRATWMGASIESYGFQRVAWDWGDGVGVIDDARLPVKQHVYAYPGIYVIRVAVKAATSTSGELNGAASTTVTIKSATTARPGS